MYKLYLSSMLLWSSSLEQIFDIATKYDFDGVELWAQQFETRGYTIDECKKLKKSYPISTIVHNYSWDLNLASLNKGIRQASIEQTKKAIDLTRNLGGTELTVHPGRKTLNNDDIEIYFDFLYQSLHEIYEYAMENKIHISLEIMEKLPLELVVCEKTIKKATLDLFDNFCYTVDIAHCDTINEIFNLTDNLLNVSKFHISNRLGNQLHTPLNNGDFNFNKLLPILSKYEIPMVLEGLDKSTDFTVLSNSIKFINNITNMEG